MRTSRGSFARARRKAQPPLRRIRRARTPHDPISIINSIFNETSVHPARIHFNPPARLTYTKISEQVFGQSGRHINTSTLI
ncbi:MAG TPA: hypothetical protein VF191_16160 [Cyclobacteriaceae bacterium]